MIELYRPRMKPNENDRLRIGRGMLLSLPFFTVLLAWAYFNLKVPLLLDDILPEFPGKDTVKGIIMALDNLLALFLQPVFGILSDRTASRLGRRVPYIVVGTAFAALFFAALPFFRFIAGFVTVVFLFNLSMSLYRTASVVVVPDYTPDGVRSKASAMQQFIANLGGVVGFAIPMVLAGFRLEPPMNDAAGFIVISVLMLVCLGVFLSGMRETPTGPGVFSIAKSAFHLDPVSLEALPGSGGGTGSGEEEERRAPIATIVAVLRRDRNFRFFLAAVACWYLGFAAVEAFFSSFAVTFLRKASEAEAGRLFMAYSVSMILSAWFMGLIGQRLGRRRAVIVFLVALVAVLGVFAAVVVPLSYHSANDILIMIFLVLIGVPWMGVIVNSFPMLWGLAGDRNVGVYTGIYYTINQAAYTLSPVVMGTILSIGISLGDYRYIAMFPFVFICFLFGLFFITRVKSRSAIQREDSQGR